MNVNAKKPWGKYIINFIIIIPICFLIAYLFGFLNSKFPLNFIDKEWYLFTKPILILLSLIFIFVILGRLFERKYVRIVVNFFRPFYKNGNMEKYKFFITISLILIFPGLIYLFYYYFQFFTQIHSLNDYNFFDQLAYILAYYGLLLTIRVYFEVEEDRTETIDDFLSKLTEILDRSDADDEIVIYAPTLFLNQAHILKGTAKFRSTVYRKKILDKNNLSIYMLDCTDMLTSIDNFKTSNNIQFLTQKKLDRETNSFVSSIQDSTSPFNKFHNWSLKSEIPDNCANKTMDYYRALILFLESLELKNKINDIHYKFDSIITKACNNYSGFFTVINFKKGLYYIGTFLAYNDAEPYFKGTFFINEDIESRMKSFFNDIILNNGSTSATNP